MTQLEATAVLPPVEDHPRQLSRNISVADKVFRTTMYGAGGLVLILTGSIGVFLGLQTIPTFKRYGWSFLTQFTWDPSRNVIGIGAAIAGTVEVAIIALIFAIPIATLSALYISEYAPRWAKPTLISVIDLMAAVPSIVFGVVGREILMPHLIFVERWLDEWLGWIPIFHVPGSNPRSAVFPQFRYDQSLFEAGMIVSLMVIPITCSVMRNVFDQAPLGEKEGAYALGATRWGMIRSVVLPFGRGGMIGGTMLGLGRALGETIAVLLVTQQIYQVRIHILDHGGITISGLVAGHFGDATGSQRTALLAAGFVLFMMTLVVNTFAAVIVNRSRSGAGVDI